jgi:hypothetical protein
MPLATVRGLLPQPNAADCSQPERCQMRRDERANVFTRSSAASVPPCVRMLRSAEWKTSDLTFPS